MSSEHTPHIVGLGNALVDVVAAVAPAVITRHDLTPGGMHLVDATAAQALFDEVGPGVRQSGGSVANSIAHLAQAGVRGTYIGKVANDDLGKCFCDEMTGLGLAAPVAVAQNGDLGTGRCVVLVTPDGERTMSTHLGAATDILPAEVRAAMPAAFDILLIEGYLWDAPQGAAVIETAAQLAREAGARVALTPSDAGCVERNREGMLTFIAEHADMLIGNHVEIGALAGKKGAKAALDWAMRQLSVAAVTEHEKGALVADESGSHHVAALPITDLVDTTGAGDAFASGFLAGIARGKPVADAGRMGAELAATVLGHYGARNGAAARAISLTGAA